MIYVTSFANFNATYGSLGAIVVVLFWLYISAFVIILGARVNGEIENATAVDTTTAGHGRWASAAPSMPIIWREKPDREPAIEDLRSPLTR